MKKSTGAKVKSNSEWKDKKRKYILGVKSNSTIYPAVKYYGTLRGAKDACTKHYGPAIHRGEHLMVRYDEHGEDWTTMKMADGWTDD
jgi:hypothetical protein